MSSIARRVDRNKKRMNNGVSNVKRVTTSMVGDNEEIKVTGGREEPDFTWDELREVSLTTREMLNKAYSAFLLIKDMSLLSFSEEKAKELDSVELYNKMVNTLKGMSNQLVDFMERFEKTLNSHIEKKWVDDKDSNLTHIVYWTGKIDTKDDRSMQLYIHAVNSYSSIGQDIMDYNSVSIPSLYSIISEIKEKCGIDIEKNTDDKIKEVMKDIKEENSDGKSKE